MKIRKEYYTCHILHSRLAVKVAFDIFVSFTSYSGKMTMMLGAAGGETSSVTDHWKYAQESFDFTDQWKDIQKNFDARFNDQEHEAGILKIKFKVKELLEIEKLIQEKQKEVVDNQFSEVKANERRMELESYGVKRKLINLELDRLISQVILEFYKKLRTQFKKLQEQEKQFAAKELNLEEKLKVLGAKERQMERIQSAIKLKESELDAIMREATYRAGQRA